MSKRYLKTIGLAFIAIALISGTAWAVPLQITYQGQLTDTEGNPVPDGDYEMSFALYDAPCGAVRSAYYFTLLNETEPLFAPVPAMVPVSCIEPSSFLRRPKSADPFPFFQKSLRRPSSIRPVKGNFVEGCFGQYSVISPFNGRLSLLIFKSVLLTLMPDL